jgi:hypothetical protein
VIRLLAQQPTPALYLRSFSYSTHHRDQPADRRLPVLWDVILLDHPVIKQRKLMRL